MPDERLRLSIGDGSVTALRSPAARARWTFIFAPGAAAGVDDGFGAHLATVLPAAGVTLVRFQFPYKERGSSRPEQPAVLQATWRAAMAQFRPRAGKLAVGGRSMGGRIASMVVADGEAADAVALFAYPLHPPGRPEAARTEHLPKLRVPTLFCSGTNDSFGTPDELRAAAALVKKPRATVHLLEGADHGFNVPKRTGRTRAEVWAEATEALLKLLT